MRSVFLSIPRQNGARSELRRRAREHENSEFDILILQAHGATDGSACAGSGTHVFLGLFRCSHFWFHACYCGKMLAPKLAEQGRIAFGFLTAIVTDYQGDQDQGLQVVLAYLDTVSTGVSPGSISDHIRELWKTKAIELLRSGDLLHAAMLSQCRLSLRYFPNPTPAS